MVSHKCSSCQPDQKDTISLLLGEEQAKQWVPKFCVLFALFSETEEPRSSPNGMLTTMPTAMLREEESAHHNLSGPDGSRHSSDQHPKDVNSKSSKYCPIFVRELLSSRRQTPEVWNFCVLQYLTFCPTYRETPEPPGTP